MRCCVPFCKNTSDNVSTSEAEGKSISFHGFPSEAHLRAAWLRALGKQDSHLLDSAVVCSQHFLNDDIYETENGSRQIATGAIPSTVQVCMICLDTDSKLFLMSKHKLEEAYEKLTGHPPHDQGNLKQTVCIQCAQRLINFSRFRDKSLRARALMIDLVGTNDLITGQHIKMINRTKHQLKSSMVLTTLGPDHCDLHILEHPSEDKQTEIEETHHRGEVKSEGSDNSLSVDRDMQVIHEDDNNINDRELVQDLLKYESMNFQCTICLEEFVHEQAHMQHICMHLQNGEVDGECDTSQVCKPHTAVSSSSSHSALVTENKQADPSPCALAAQTSVAPLSARLTTENIKKVRANEETDAVRESNNGELVDSCKSIKLINCVVKLNDIFENPEQGVLKQDESFVISSSASKNIKTKDKMYCSAVSRSNNKEPDIKEVNDKVSKTCETDSSKHDIQNVSECYLEKKCFACDVCSIMFKRKSLLVKHINTHNIVKRFSCTLCKYKCKHNSRLILHMMTHTGEKPLSCKLCDYKCVRKSNLVYHMKNHTGEKPHTCKLCDYKCAQPSDLVKHLRTHTGEKPFSCKFCKYKFTQGSALAKHLRTHTGEKPFSCKFCDFKCVRKESLVPHMRTHTGETPYSCNLCQYKCALKHTLVKHVQTHMGEKQFPCTICNKKLVSNSSLRIHMRTHTGEKPFSCKLCEYKCSQGSALVKHLRTHTGEKLLSCKLCAYKCNLKRDLMRHAIIHAGEKPILLIGP